MFFEKRIPQNLPFVKTWQDMENAKPLPQSQKTTQTQQAEHRKKLQKRGAPLVEQRKICYTILHDAPSPSGKAGDFDSIPKDGCIISDLYEAFKIVGDSIILKAFFFSKFNRKICCAGQKEIF